MRETAILEAEELASSICDDVLILESETPTAQLVPLAISAMNKTDPIALAQLSRHLLHGYLLKLLRAKRKANSQPEQYTLPGFPSIPSVIVVRGRKRKSLADATYTDLHEYCKYLGAKEEQKRRRNRRLIEVRELTERMKRPSEENPGITVAEVFGV